MNKIIEKERHTGITPCTEPKVLSSLRQQN